MRTFHRARNYRPIKDDIYNYKAVIHEKINCSGIASPHWSHWFGCLAIKELSFQSVRLVLTLSPLSEYPFIAKAENSGKAENDDDSLQQSPVPLHGPSDLVLKGDLASPTDLAKDNFWLRKQLPGVIAVVCRSGVTSEQRTQFLGLAMSDNSTLPFNKSRSDEELR